MQVRPYALLGDSVLAKAKLQLNGVIERWCSAWGIEADAVGLQCARASATAAPLSSVWSECHAGAGKSLWFSWPPEFAKQVQRAMFPVDRRHYMPAQTEASLAAEGATAALQALAEQIAACFASSAAKRNAGGDAPGAKEFSTGSGALLVTIKIGEQSCLCLLNYDCIRAIADASKPPAGPILPKVNLKKALSKAVVVLPVEIGQAEVDMGSLLTLGLGDVIRLNASVDKPLVICGPGGEPMFGGYLGSLEKMVAIEVVRREK